MSRNTYYYYILYTQGNFLLSYFSDYVKRVSHVKNYLYRTTLQYSRSSSTFVITIYIFLSLKARIWFYKMVIVILKRIQTNDAETKSCTWASAYIIYREYYYEREQRSKIIRITVNPISKLEVTFSNHLHLLIIIKNKHFFSHLFWQQWTRAHNMIPVVICSIHYYFVVKKKWNNVYFVLYTYARHK